MHLHILAVPCSEGEGGAGGLPSEYVQEGDYSAYKHNIMGQGMNINLLNALFYSNKYLFHIVIRR